MLVRDGTWQFLLGNVNGGDSGISCQTGKWVHLALVYQQGHPQFWANGQRAKLRLGGIRKPVPVASNGSFTIGGTPENAAASFDGQIDEVRLSEFQGPFDAKMLLFQQSSERRK